VRILNLIDEYTRESLLIRAERRWSSAKVISALADVMVWKGVPEHLRSDNGPEFVAKDLRKWLAETGANTLYIEPGSPWENGYCESFNSKLRNEFLNGEIFYSIKELRVLAERWRVHYNTVRPVVCDIICRRYFVIICRKLFPCRSWRRGQGKPVNVRYRAVSCSNHTLKVGRCVRSRWIRVCFSMSQRLIVHPRTDATNSGKRSTTNNVTSYIDRELLALGPGIWPSHHFRDRVPPESRVFALHVFQPQTNPRYQCTKGPYDSLALFETPSHALQLVENTLVTSLITQRS
jgi:hypothetical protein